MPDPRIVKSYKFFRIEQEVLQSGRKTCDYRIVNLRSGDIIGQIRWYGAWRQYCFMPCGDTIWSAGCLADVQSFITSLKG